jgi:hypothetical protein
MKNEKSKREKMKLLLRPMFTSSQMFGYATEEDVEKSLNFIVDNMVPKFLAPPSPPLMRLITENGGDGICESCGNSLKKAHWIFGKLFCINPKCKNSKRAEKYEKEIRY